ncbi:unnamed protein product [Adineta steineri]|uniref:Uncharacterized protein n=1 Tax=Adineta steineri TaxID=433720 RepID=A0A815PMB5_9BILA|nr:unnamed protein product [Adineta steineri]CAF1451792.1 unnamed protein product [Adineta steineri]
MVFITGTAVTATAVTATGVALAFGPVMFGLAGKAGIELTKFAWHRYQDRRQENYSTGYYYYPPIEYTSSWTTSHWR